MHIHVREYGKGRWKVTGGGRVAVIASGVRPDEEAARAALRLPVDGPFTDEDEFLTFDDDVADDVDTTAIGDEGEE